jgi:hypothetical protein
VNCDPSDAGFGGMVRDTCSTAIGAPGVVDKQ